MPFIMNLTGQVNQMRLPKSKALWPLFETVVNSIQSLEDTDGCTAPQITIRANRIEYAQVNTDGADELSHFETFIVRDNGTGFTERNYQSFLEAYSTLKVKKGCKGIGRFLWLKAFDEVRITSTFSESGKWFQRRFSFTLQDEIVPIENLEELSASESCTTMTEVVLLGFHPQYRDEVALSLESLARKIIEHCLPYFIMDGCPQILLSDNTGGKVNLNDYYKNTYQDTLHRDDIAINGKPFSIYHMMVEEGADKHELHLCANNREVKSYDLSKEKIRDEKKQQIDNFVRYKKPQYRYLLNNRENVYDKIPVGLSEDKLDLELYRQEQQWEYDVAKQRNEIETKQKSNAMTSPDFMNLFHQYCSSVTQLSQASLAEYIVRRKAVIDLLERALEYDKDGKFSKESTIHSIICPMQVTSDDIQFDEMNLWLIDDRLAYHNFLASDQPMKSLPVLQSDVSRRMDIAVFDKAISYSADTDMLNSITIIELKRPQRDDLNSDGSNPINQVLKYVSDIKAGKVKRSNGRGFGNVNNAAFYCYVIADITETLANAAENANLNRTPDGEGFFGFNAPRGAYIEVISYTKLLKDAKQRNEILFDKLFKPKSEQIINLHGDIGTY